MEAAIRDAAIQRIKADEPLPRDLAGAVVAIGNFDGVHRGHRAVLEQALALARSERRPGVALTFEPHPRTYFRPEKPVFRLTPAPLKAHLLALCGYDGVVECSFDAPFAAQSAAEFVRHVLVDRLGAAHVVTGFDFHFGKHRQGGSAYLMEAGKTHGFGVTVVDAFRDENAEVISSSRIRALLAEGEAMQAAGLLGYRFAIEGTVIRGRQLGRTLGYPTANMALAAETALQPGIYAVRYRRADGTLHDGVASFGHRPTVEKNGAILLETYLFDFTGDLYGEEGRVSFFSRLRGEEKFDGLEALVARMKIDEAQARAALCAAAPLGAIDAELNF